MIFMDSQFWTEQIPAYDLLKRMAKSKPYGKLIFLHDESDDAIKSVLEFHGMRKPLLTRLHSAPRKAGA